MKRENERLNIQKLYFPMCHPSFFRRLVFRLREETVGIRRGWADGYGCTCGEELTNRIIGLEDTDIVICKPDELGIRGRDLFEYTENAFSYIQKKEKTKTLTLPTIEREYNGNKNK